MIQPPKLNLAIHSTLSTALTLLPRLQGLRGVSSAIRADDLVVRILGPEPSVEADMERRFFRVAGFRSERALLLPPAVALFAARSESGPVESAPITFESRVLIVDDEPELQAAAQRTLARAGYRTSDTAFDGQDALDYLREHPEVAFVITDYEMYPMDGLALARTLRKARPDFPIIIATSAPEKLKENLQPGEENAYVILTKPVVNANLTAALKAIGAPVRS